MTFLNELETNTNNSSVRRDIHQQVTDTIIRQLEAGTVPWQQPWKSDSSRILELPRNLVSEKHYRGINILLLWSAAIEKQFPSPEWASFKQWNARNESIRKGEKGSLIVYYDTVEKEVDGEIKKIPFLKSSIVFNRCQLASYTPDDIQPEAPVQPLVERLETVDRFVCNTKAIVEHDGSHACYVPTQDKILMPHPEAFRDTLTCKATEGYYSTLLHELTHWSGNPKRLNRTKGKKFGDNDYAVEELTAELGAAFLCAEFGIGIAGKGNHAAYIAHWLEVLKSNKQCLFTAASEASKAVDYMQDLQPA